MVSLRYLHSFLFIANATFNSFRNQVGYCKLQGFNTISRSTSKSIPMFLDSRIAFGVGLSDVEFQSNVSYCGSCIQIHEIYNFAIFSNDLTSWKNSDILQNKTSFIVMVMDQCTDPICQQQGFLDFDIYSETQPVQDGNPANVLWNFVPCPILPNEMIEFLVCLSATCKKNDKQIWNSAEEILQNSSPYFLSIYIRNQRLPIWKVSIINYHVEMENNNGWVVSSVMIDFYHPITIQLNDDIQITETISLLDYSPIEDYHGGFIIPTHLQT